MAKRTTTMGRGTLLFMGGVLLVFVLWVVFGLHL
jgi:hypothetical protein